MWPFGMTDGDVWFGMTGGDVAGQDIPQNQLETVLDSAEKCATTYPSGDSPATGYDLRLFQDRSRRLLLLVGRVAGPAQDTTDSKYHEQVSALEPFALSLSTGRNARSHGLLSHARCGACPPRSTMHCGLRPLVLRRARFRFDRRPPPVI